ncbi:MAG: PDZ domain-containing protein [Planctomycetota bacterium]|nr:PDZ domain-containing protein [Planctomycetota bacterium]
MRASFVTAILLALSGAPTFAHAALGSHEPGASEIERSGTPATEHGAPKALAVSIAAGPGEVELGELGRALDEINALIEAARQDEEKKRAEAERAAAVLRALETDLSRIEALLVESMADRRGADEMSAPRVIGSADDVAADETSGAVELRLVDLSDSGAVARVPAPAADARGYMGVEVVDGDDGVTISSVVDGSPAAAAGLRTEDVLFNLGGSSVVDVDGLIESMSAYAAGDTVAVGIMRGKKPMRRRVTLGARSATRGATPSTVVTAESAPLALGEVSDEIILEVEMEGARLDGARRLRLIRSDADGDAIIAIAGELEGEIIEREIEWADEDEECCGECGEHEDEECCGECEEHEHEECCGECEGHEHEECCGECEGHEEECCGECGDGHGHESGYDPLPEGYEEIYERRETRSVHDGHEEEEIVVRRERRPVRDDHGHDDHDDHDWHDDHDGHDDHDDHDDHDGHDDHDRHDGHDRYDGHDDHDRHDDHRDGVGHEIEQLHLRIERLEREIEGLTEVLIDIRREMDRRSRR